MDVDVSSYRTDPQPSALDIAGKLGGLKAQSQGIERQGIGIEHDKLNLANQRLGILSKEYTTLLSDPDVNNGTPNAPSKAQAAGQRLVNLGLIPAPMFGEFVKSIPTDPKEVKSFVKQQITRAQSIQEALNYHLGQPAPPVQNGQTIQQQTFTQGEGYTPQGQPIQQQVPVTQETIDDQGRQRLQGPTPAVAVPGTVTGPGQRLPVAPMQQPDISKRIVGAAGSEPAAKVPAPSGPATGQPVLFGEGLKRYDADTQVANEKLTAVRPAIQAYRIMDGLRSGPGTETWNKAVAFLKANNIIPIQTKDDPTAIYQEVNKKLSQYVAGSGTRSDADQALREASNPSVKTQISPALIKLTRDAIALDRARALVPYAFEGGDYSKYIEHRGKFPTQISEQALTLDLLPPKERSELINDMKKKQNSFEGKKFWSTLNLVDKHQLIDTGGQ